MAPRDDEKAMDGLLRRSLARHGAAGGACPEPDILAAYYERSLDAEEMARHEQHFSQCARCREQLAAILRAGSVTELPMVLEVKDAARAAPEALAQSRVARGAPENPARPGKFDWRWLAPVAAAILVVVFLYGRNASRLGKPQIPGNELALSKQEAVPPAGVADAESGAQHPASPPARTRTQGNGTAHRAAPAVARELPQMARNYSALPPLQEEKTNPIEALHSESEPRDDLTKRAEAATASAMDKPAPPQMVTLPQEKTDARVAPASRAPDAAPTPGPARPTEAATKRGETRAAGAGQRSLGAGVVNSAKQKQAAAGANAGANVTVTSQVLEVTSATTVIETPDASVQYRIPGAGFIERSSDGGATWQGQSVKSDAEILAGAAPSVNVCWLVGRGGVILMTTDGKSWKKVPSPAVADLVGVTAADAAFATVTAADGQRFSTENGGRTWQLMK
jgi:hypothetical protein